MQSLKIKVNNEAESKEVQELFFELGGAWGHCGKNLANLDAKYFRTNCMEITCTDDDEIFTEWDGKETTLAELRDMVSKEQDEPFLTPETTLNDQYAEIEQVRQAIKVKSGSDSDHAADAMSYGLMGVKQVQQDGLKFDNGKPRHSLLPKGAISSVISVLEFGAKKYEANNWQKVENAKDRYYDAAMRHIDSWWNGEKFDQETGIHHLAHAATNLFFLKWFDDKDNSKQ